jgi:hypothetical protein
MREMIRWSGLVAVTAAGALALLAGPSVAASPGDVAYCSSTSPTDTCSAVWTADAKGSFSGWTSGSYEIDQWKCTTDAITGVRTCAWVELYNALGPGNVILATGALVPGNKYQFVINGAGFGMLGSITGTDTL